MNQLIAIAAGGALGSVARFWMSSGVYQWLGRDFPYGTLAVNVVGCFLMGLLSVLLIERLALGPEWRAAILIGVLGGFTTFSAFSFETLSLLEAGAISRAIMNVVMSVVLCLVAVWLGAMSGRQL